MFTGLVERSGKVIAILPATEEAAGEKSEAITRIIVDPGPHQFKTKLGDSVSINGCCLTVTAIELSTLEFEVSSETLDKTNLGLLHQDDTVNLERAMAVGDRLGGHIVSGHVDGTGIVHNLVKKPDGWLLQVKLSKELSRYVITKGSITLDGISLTVNTVDDGDDDCTIGLMLIPKTVETTTVKDFVTGQALNIEVDMIAKFVERLSGPWQSM